IAGTARRFRAVVWRAAQADLVRGDNVARDVASAWKSVVRVTTAAVSVVTAHVAGHFATARRLANLHARRTIRLAQATATIATAAAQHTVDASAERRTLRRRGTSADLATRSDIALTGATLVVGRADVVRLRAIRRAELADLVDARPRATVLVNEAGIT